MKRITPKERMERERKVKAMVDDGASINDIAKHFGISQQGIHKFMKLRGWKTKEALRREGKASGEPTEEEKKRAERAERRRQMKKDVVDRS